MKKRAGLARAMALDPTVLFLTSLRLGWTHHLCRTRFSDQKHQSGIGTTMVIVTHELQSTFSIADRIIMLDKEAKGIIAEGDPRWLKDNSTDPRVNAFFNRKMLARRQGT